MIEVLKFASSFVSNLNAKNPSEIAIQNLKQTVKLTQNTQNV